jgi:hypothetical protein
MAYFPLLPFAPLSTYLEPSFCDRIRPPRSHVARKLTPLFPHLAHVPFHPKPRLLLGFLDPNMHLIRTTLRTHPILANNFKWWRMENKQFTYTLKVSYREFKLRQKEFAAHLKLT